MCGQIFVSFTNLGHERHVTMKANTQSRSCIEVLQCDLLFISFSSLVLCRILCEQGLESIVLRKTVTDYNSSSHALQLEVRFFLHKLKCMKYCRLQLICLPRCVKRNHGRIFCSTFDIRSRKVMGYFVVLCSQLVCFLERKHRVSGNHEHGLYLSEFHINWQVVKRTGLLLLSLLEVFLQSV